MTDDTMNEIRPLKAALNELAEAVTQLCDPLERTVLRDDLTTTEHIAPSLLSQIAQLGHGGETGKGKGAPNRLPLDPSQLDAWIEIRTSSQDLHDRAVMHSQLTPEQHIRRIAELAQSWSDPQAVLWVRDHLLIWRRMILSVLEPRRHAHLAAACPACEVRMVWRQDDHGGERVQVPALSVDGQTGCTCLACGAHWAPQQLEHLAMVLGCTPVQKAS